MGTPCINPFPKQLLYHRQFDRREHKSFVSAPLQGNFKQAQLCQMGIGEGAFSPPQFDHIYASINQYISIQKHEILQSSLTHRHT